MTLLAHLGMPRPHQFMLHVLAPLHLIAFGNRTVQLAPSPFITHLPEGVHKAYIHFVVRSAPAYKNPFLVPLWLIQAVVSATRPSAMSRVAHVMGYEPLVGMAAWRRRVPNVWVATSEHTEDQLVEEAVRRRSMGHTMYSVMTSRIAPSNAVRTQGDVESCSLVCLVLCLLRSLARIAIR